MLCKDGGGMKGKARFQQGEEELVACLLADMRAHVMGAVRKLMVPDGPIGTDCQQGFLLCEAYQLLVRTNGCLYPKGG